jgi:uncharacterized membrane protein YvbJ
MEQIIKISVQVSTNLRQRERYNESRKQSVGFFENINKISKPSAKVTKRRKEKTQINIKDEKGYITTDTNEIQIIWEYFVNLYCTKLENEEEINFLSRWPKIEPR